MLARLTISGIPKFIAEILFLIAMIIFCCDSPRVKSPFTVPWRALARPSARSPFKLTGTPAFKKVPVISSLISLSTVTVIPPIASTI